MKTWYVLLLTTFMFSIHSCDTGRTGKANPLLEVWDTPFGVPPFEKIKPEHFKPAYIEAMQQHYNEIEAIIDNEDDPNFENVILALDQAGRLLGRIGSTFSIMIGANSTEEMQAVQQEMIPITSAHWSNINMNEKLFAKVKAVYDNRAGEGLDDLQLRLLENRYNGFVRSGALLNEKDKERLKEINTELSSATSNFGNNMLAGLKNFVVWADSAQVKSLPLAIQNMGAAKAEELGQKGRYAFTLAKPSLIPVLRYSDQPELRKELYMGYINQCNYGDSTDNREIVNDIVRLRLEKAQILGYPTHAHYILEDRMARNVEEVYELLNGLYYPSLETAREEMSEMQELKRRETGIASFDAWDWWYYAEKLRKDKYDLDEEMLAPYFSIENVQAGIFDLSNRLYGITFRPVSIPKYHKECDSYEVLDVDGSHLGIIILDMHYRDGKRSGAWCSTFQGRTYLDGEKVTDPIITITCNFSRPDGRRPALLTLDETTTFFHEFGHALHFIFTDVPYRGLMRTERDFVELPSQIMENWALEPAMLRRYAVHHSRNDVIPENLIEKIQRSAFFNQGFEMTERLAAALSDMDIHTIENYSPIQINDYEAEKLNVERNLIPQIAPRYRYPYFNHIFNGGYSAGYYSYMWSEVLDKDAFEAFAETGDIFNKKVATRFRTEILEKGGSQDGATLYMNFRGKEPSRDYLLYARGLKERPARELEPELIVDDMDADDSELLETDAETIGTDE